MRDAIFMSCLFCWLIFLGFFVFETFRQALPGSKKLLVIWRSALIPWVHKGKGGDGMMAASHERYSMMGMMGTMGKSGQSVTGSPCLFPPLVISPEGTPFISR